jgi:hypothetical protein
MPQVGFESTIPVVERPKTLHALNRAVIVIDVSEVIFDKLDGAELKARHIISSNTAVERVVFLI